MKLLSRTILLLCVLCFFGCSRHGDPVSADNANGSLVGSWTNESLKGETQVVTFRKNGTLDIQGSFNNGKGVLFEATALYKVAGNRYSMKPTSVTLFPPKASNAKLKTAVKAGNRSLAKKATFTNAKTDTGVLTWKDRNTVVLTNKSGKSVVFKRRA